MPNPEEVAAVEVGGAVLERIAPEVSHSLVNGLSEIVGKKAAARVAGPDFAKLAEGAIDEFPFAMPKGVISANAEGTASRAIGDFHIDTFKAAQAGDDAARSEFVRSLGIPDNTLRSELAHASVMTDRPDWLSSISHVDNRMWRIPVRTGMLEDMTAVTSAGDLEGMGGALDRLFYRSPYQARWDFYGG